MRHAASVALTFALIALAGVSVPFAQTRAGRARSPRPAAAPATVEGRVLAGGTATPLRRVAVAAVNAAGTRIEATTDEEGRYRLDRLTPGQWRITASKSGFFDWQIGQRHPFDAPPPIVLTGGQRLEADISLSRGGAISGRVYDEFGEGLAGLQVRVYRGRVMKGQRRVQAVGSTDLTDDTGAFRIYGLPPGTYYVAASLRVAPVDSVVETTYAPTYFPGTGSLSEAQPIRLELGSEATAVFPLLPIRRLRVSGLVLSSSGEVADAFLNLESEATELGVPIGVGGVTRSDGTFTLPDVPPGRYILNASLRGDGQDESASVPVTVATDDVSGVTLVTGRAATLRAALVADAGVSRPLPTGVEVTAIAVRSGLVLSSDSGIPFDLDNLTEPIRLSIEGLPDEWAVKDIVVNGISQIEGPIELARNQQAEARIVLTDRVTEVSGTVDGATSESAVVVFAEDAGTWGFRSRYIREASTDSRGRFRISGLPAGRYLAIATDRLEEGEQTDPEFLARTQPFAVAFPLQEGEKRAIYLRLIER